MIVAESSKDVKPGSYPNTWELNMLPFELSKCLKGNYLYYICTDWSFAKY